MGDHDWDKVAVVRSCSINKPNNVVASMLYLATSLNDNWNLFNKLFAPGMISFNSLS